MSKQKRKIECCYCHLTINRKKEAVYKLREEKPVFDTLPCMLSFYNMVDKSMIDTVRKEYNEINHVEYAVPYMNHEMYGGYLSISEYRSRNMHIQERMLCK